MQKTLLGAALFAASAIVAVTVWAFSPAPFAAAAPGWTVIGSGPDYVHNVPNPFSSGAEATVSARTIADGGLQVRLEVAGVAAAGERFGAHVHTNPCGPSATASGGHYVDATEDGSLRHREIWLDFTVASDGTGVAIATREWTVSGARSVVFHANTTDHHGLAGARLACVDVDFDALS